MSRDYLGETFLGAGPAGYGVSAVQGAVLVTYAGSPTYSNEVTDGAITWSDCGIACDPTTLVLGRVLLIMTPAKPIILGNLYVPTA